MVWPFSTPQLALVLQVGCLALPSAPEVSKLRAIQMEVATKLLQSSQPCTASSLGIGPTRTPAAGGPPFASLALGRVCPGQFDLRMYRRNISRPGSQRHEQCTGDKEQIGERWHLSCLVLPSSVRRSRILQGWDVVAKADRGSGGSATLFVSESSLLAPLPKKYRHRNAQRNGPFRGNAML
jgi:hypothetical protein